MQWGELPEEIRGILKAWERLPYPTKAAILNWAELPASIRTAIEALVLPLSEASGREGG